MSIQDGTSKFRKIQVNEFICRTGTVIPFAGSVIPNGWLLCNGAEVSKTTYADLYAVIGDGYGTASSGKFKLPNVTDRVVQGGSVGSYKEAGLPNITGTVNFHGVTGPNYIWRAFDCFSPHSYYEDYKLIGEVEPDSEGSYGELKFNASNSNSIYGNSSTVQPPAVCMNYIIKY